MERKHVEILIVVGLTATLALLVLVDPALAAPETPPSKAGEKVKDMALGLAAPLAVGFVAIMALGGLFAHSFGKIMAVLGMGIAVGVPIFATNEFTNFMKEIARLLVG